MNTGSLKLKEKFVQQQPIDRGQKLVYSDGLIKLSQGHPQ